MEDWLGITKIATDPLGRAQNVQYPDGDSVITYGYDKTGRIAEKHFPNGMHTAYRYDSKGKIQELVHKDREGIPDNYIYQYDLLGNKIGIDKQRRGLEEEKGSYQYGYDSLGRLNGVTKDGVPLRTYRYDAFGNRTKLTEQWNYNQITQVYIYENEGLSRPIVIKCNHKKIVKVVWAFCNYEVLERILRDKCYDKIQYL